MINNVNYWASVRTYSCVTTRIISYLAEKTDKIVFYMLSFFPAKYIKRNAMITNVFVVVVVTVDVIKIYMYGNS